MQMLKKSVFKTSFAFNRLTGLLYNVYLGFKAAKSFAYSYCTVSYKMSEKNKNERLISQKMEFNVITRVEKGECLHKQALLPQVWTVSLKQGS